MFEAQYLWDGDTFFSPWMPRGGDNVRITAECVAHGGNDTEVQLFEKNSEDTGSGAEVTAAKITLSAVGRTTLEYVALKEMVRYRFKGSGSAGKYCALRMLAPVWFDDVTV